MTEEQEERMIKQQEEIARNQLIVDKAAAETKAAIEAYDAAKAKDPEK